MRVKRDPEELVSVITRDGDSHLTINVENNINAEQLLEEVYKRYQAQTGYEKTKSGSCLIVKPGDIQILRDAIIESIKVLVGTQHDHWKNMINQPYYNLHTIVTDEELPKFVEDVFCVPAEELSCSDLIDGILLTPDQFEELFKDPLARLVPEAIESCTNIVSITINAQTIEDYQRVLKMLPLQQLKDLAVKCEMERKTMPMLQSIITGQGFFAKKTLPPEVTAKIASLVILASKETLIEGEKEQAALEMGMANVISKM